MAAVMDHIAALVGRVKQGRVGAIARGGNTGRAGAAGIGLACRDRWGVHVGRGVDLLREMWRRGYLPTLTAAPNEDTAGRAMVLLAKKTPLVQIVRRGLYRVYACDPAFLPAAVVAAIVDAAQGDDADADDPEPPIETPENQADFDATVEVDCWPWPDELVSSGSSAPGSVSEKVPFCEEIDGTEQCSSLRARGVNYGGDPLAHRDLEGPAADPDATELKQPGGLGCAPSGPAETAQPSPDAAAASPAVAPMTKSAWLQAIPQHPRQQQAAQLASSPVPDLAGRSPSATMRARMEGQQVSTGQGQRVRSRDVAAVTRAAAALHRLGLLDPQLRPPPTVVHPALAAFEVRPNPGPERPTAAQVAWCRSSGIEPAGLSRAEAQALREHVRRRVEAGRLWRLMRKHGAASSFAATCGGQVAEGLVLAAAWVRTGTSDEGARVSAAALGDQQVSGRMQ